MQILATEFNFTKLAGIPGGRGQQGLWANFRKWVDNLWGTCQGFNWSAVSNFLQGVLQGFLGAL